MLIAVILAICGTTVAILAGMLLWANRTYIPEPHNKCAMPAPDDSVDDCTGTLGHVGWHHNDGAGWFGAVWGETTTTRPARRPTPATGSTATGSTSDDPQESVLITLLLTGFAAIIGILALSSMFTMAKPYDDARRWADQHAGCAWRLREVQPGMVPLCTDSPDWDPKWPK